MQIISNKISWKVGLVLLLAFLALTGGYGLAKFANDFFENNRLQFNRMVEIKLDFPVSVLAREKVRIVKEVQVLEYPGEIDTPLKEYICKKFGVYECKTALAVAQAESGFREDAFNAYNTNGTIDVGLFQINSVHYSKPGCSLKEIVDAKKNVDCAYLIYKASGWHAWSAWKSGAYISKL